MVLIIGITGASGVIYGIRLLEVLSTQKDVETHVVISGAGETNIKHEKFWVQSDIRQKQDLINKVVDLNPQYIVHLAARTDLDGKNSADYAANIEGVQNLIDACKKLNDLKRIGFASSRLVCRIGYTPKNENDVSDDPLNNSILLNSETPSCPPIIKIFSLSPTLEELCLNVCN